MPDYNIYIHALGSSATIDNPTTPIDNTISPSGTGETGQGFENFKTAMNTFSGQLASGPSNLLNTGVAMLGRSFPIVAAVLAAVKGADNVISSGFGHLETYTGNYEFSMGYNNFKTIVGNATNPFGLFMKEIQRQASYNKQNMRIEQQRTLIGVSYLNKIGV